MRIATFNVNSIRARMPRLKEWLAEADPDIVAIQETKVEDALFPFADLEDTGYEIAISGQKRYNGVCFLSKKPLENVTMGFGDDSWEDDRRIITAVIDGVLVINTYVPNGTQVGIDKWEYKMRWLERFRKLCNELGTSQDKMIWLGDINVAPKPEDVYDSKKVLGGVGHHPDEFVRLNKICDWGWTDVFRKLHPEERAYTFWDFRMPSVLDRDLGWRIDHIYASEPMAEQVTKCWVDRDARAKEKPSDHAPLLAEFDWK
ncbi:MAG: exodeoxyribonuclease III [Fimbriimonadaceae bacterium]